MAQREADDDSGRSASKRIDEAETAASSDAPSSGVASADAESQALSQLASRFVRLGGWKLTLPERRMSWSEEAAAIHDATRQDAPQGDEVVAAYLVEHRNRVSTALDHCMTRGLPFDLEAEMLTRQGRRVWVRLMGEPVRDEAGTVVGLQGALQDVTEQRRTSDHLRSSADRLQETLEMVSDAFFTLDRDWKFSFLNTAAERFLRRKRTELLGRGIWDEFPQAVGTESDTQYHRAMDDKVAIRFEQFYPPLNKWFEAEAHPTAFGIAVYFRDVSERRKIFEKLREQAALLDRANDAILVRDLDHHILYWNQGAEKLYGWTAAEAVGRSIRELLYADPSDFNRATAITLTQNEWRGEIEQRTQGGTTLLVQGRWTLMRDEAGNPQSILAINTDITQRKKLEAQFLRAQRMESIGALAGGIAHDLNNTLSPILLAVSSLEDENLPATVRDDLTTIASCARRGADMVQQLLAFARGTGDRRSKVQLGKIASELRKLVKDTFPKNIELDVNVARDLWEIEADPTQIHQVLTNLCVNARDAMPTGGKLIIALERVVIDETYGGMNWEAQPGPYVLIRVEDTGTGMPPEVADRMFEPFFTTKQIGKGTGLGLSTAHAIVRNHGGFIHAYSELGRGTRFRIYLPALTTTVSPEVSEEVSRLPRGNGELILIVDDEDLIREITERTLVRYGYRVLSASNGAEAVSLYALQRGEIAAVLTDMTMPVMDGAATIVALRSMNPEVRIIGSSGLDANGQLARAVGAGIHRFIAKPYTAEALLVTLREVLTESS